MTLYTEKGIVEDFIIHELQKLGWKYIELEEMKLKRKGDFEEPLVIEDLRNARSGGKKRKNLERLKRV